MELLEGESLQHRLHVEHSTSHSLLDIAIATADGLDAAHGHGLHSSRHQAGQYFSHAARPQAPRFRPRKAEAGALKVPGRTTRPGRLKSLLTEAGVTVGRVAYMSPEQLTRQRALTLEPTSSASASFSMKWQLGARLFPERRVRQSSGAILYEQPIPPIEIAHTIPTRLNDIILKAIEKDREDRSDSCDLRTDLRRLRRELDSHPSHSTSTLAGARHVSDISSWRTSRQDSRPGRSIETLSTSGRCATTLLVIAAVAGLDALHAAAGDSPRRPSRPSRWRTSRCPD